MFRIVITHFWKMHQDEILVLLAGGGAFGVWATNIEVILKILISFATLVFIGLKIYTHYKRYLDNKKEE